MFSADSKTVAFARLSGLLTLACSAAPPVSTTSTATGLQHAKATPAESHAMVMAAAGTSGSMATGPSQAADVSSASAPVASSKATVPPAGRPCGPLRCLAFDSAEAAILHVLEAARPQVLSVGEIHAQKGHRLAATPTARFTALLPLFRGRTRDLVLELWTSRNDCGDDRVERVRQAQAPVVQAQASTNPNEYFELGKVARTLGVQPHALVPTCDEYRTILEAGTDDISRMLELTAVKTRQLVESALQRPSDAPGYPRVVTYGGALHNDLSPRPGRESWSFGTALEQLTQGKYVELDLVLREQVRDTESFTRLPWYPYLRDESLHRDFVLYEAEPSSFALVFPKESYLK